MSAREKADVWQGTLALMILKTLETIGPLHGYGIARRIEQTSGDKLALNYGTLYPALLKLEQEGYIAAEWGASDNNRKAKYYKLTRAGHKQVERETKQWNEATNILLRFLSAVSGIQAQSATPRTHTLSTVWRCRFRRISVLVYVDGQSEFLGLPRRNRWYFVSPNLFG